MLIVLLSDANAVLVDLIVFFFASLLFGKLALLLAVHGGLVWVLRNWLDWLRVGAFHLLEGALSARRGF